MVDKLLLDLYTDYLISSFSLTTATGLSDMLDHAYSHDKITRFLSKEIYTQKDYWKAVKPIVRQVEDEDGIICIDDTIEEKPYTDENDIVCWHYDHTKGKNIKGINIVNFLYHTELGKDQDISFPLSFEIVSKIEKYFDEKTQKMKRKSKITKNEMVRERLKILMFTNCVKFRYAVWDTWFSSKENMEFVKKELKKDFVCAIKTNRTVALSYKDKLEGKFVKVSELDIKPDTTHLVYLKGLDFPVLLAKQFFTNKDGSIGVLYLVSSDISLTYCEITMIYKRRWKVETFHKSLKQNVSLEKSPTKTVKTQSNHIFASMIAFIKLELLKLKTNMNQFALKNRLYIRAIRECFLELEKLKQIDNNSILKTSFA